MYDTSYTEPFEFGDDFLKRYLFFLRKYASTNYSALDLMKDLQVRFGCIAVALFRYKPETNLSVTRCYPSQKQGLIGRVLKQDKTKKLIHELFEVERYGDSFGLETPKTSKEKSTFREVDLIPLPRLADSEMQTDSAQLFIFLDPAYLKPVANHQAERDWQRTMIAQFLCGWWVRITAPKFGFVQPVTHVANWLYIATLSELLQEGHSSAEAVRRYDPDREIYFQGEMEGDIFDWGQWTPRYPFSGRSNNDMEKIRDRGRSLTYWCRWVHSHHDLEREQTVLTSPSSTKTASYISVTEWAKKQQQGISIVNKRLEELRTMAANEFLMGRAEAIIELSEEDEPSEDEGQNNLSIGPKSLLCFNLNQWLAPGGQLRTDLASGVFSDIEFCRTLHGVAVIAHYLLGKQGSADDVIHRLMHLVALYGHGDLGIPARIDLRAHLLQAARGEPALHVLKRFYRDHFFHALEVCFLGHVLLETQLDENRCLWQLVAEHLRLPENRQQVLRLWYLAALLHDIGYAMDVLNSSRKFLGFFKHSKALQSLDKSFEQALKDLSNEEEVGKLGVNKKEDGIEQDHGVIGALHLRSLLERINQDDQNVIPDEYMPAIQAIALHNLRRHDAKLSFSKQPLAFLLAICDQLQEWRRPRLPFATSPNWLLARLDDASTESAEIEGAFKSMKANLNVLSGNADDIQLRFRADASGRPILAFTMEYDKRINRNSGVFSVWLDATLKFQRLDFEGLPLDISVTYITPLYENHMCNMPQPQLHRLRNAAHETHMSFLMEWFPTRQETSANILTNGAVMYQRNDNREELTLDLRTLSSKVLVTRGMDAFWKCLQEWKNFDDDRDFPGDYVSVTPE